MSRTGALAGSVRRAGEAWLAAALLMGAAPALAGDRALLDFIGYSADGHYFAFEEFGIQDGSGFAYSNLYVVDLATDSWVDGTPLRLRADDESVRLAELRRQNSETAQPLLDQLDISQPAQIAALIGDGEPDPVADALSFGLPGYGPGEAMGQYRLDLDSFPARSPEPCESYLGEPAKGYALTLSGDGAPRELHRDATLPASRGCPVAYRLYGVTLPMDQAELTSAVAIISVYPHGFEGPDRRFIAVPLRN